MAKQRSFSGNAFWCDVRYILSVFETLVYLIFKFLRSYLPRDPLGRPGVPVIKSKREVYDMAQVKHFEYTLEPPDLPPPHDAVRQSLHYSVDGEAKEPVEGAFGTDAIITVLPDKEVVLFWKVSDGRNESPAGGSRSFTSVDDIAPPAPGVPNFRSHREVFIDIPDEPPVEEPPVEEPPVEEPPVEEPPIEEPPVEPPVDEPPVEPPVEEPPPPPVDEPPVEPTPEP
jgi:hypothetical protein